MAGLPSTWRGEEADMCACGDVEVCSGRGGEVCFELWVIVVREKKVRVERSCSGGVFFFFWRLTFCGEVNENEEQRMSEQECEWVVSV